MSDPPGEETPGRNLPPGWSPEQPPPWYPSSWGPPGPDHRTAAPARPDAGRSGSPPEATYGGASQASPGYAGPGEPGSGGTGSPPPGWRYPGGGPPGWGLPPGSRPSGFGQPAFGHPGWGPYPGPKPGVVPLRPLGVSEILDGAIAYIRQHPAATLALAAIVMAIAQAIELVLEVLLGGSASLDPDALQYMTNDVQVLNYFSTTLIIEGATTLVGEIATLVLTGVLTAVVGRAVLGRSCSLGEGWRDARPRLPAVIAAAVLTFVIIFVAMFVCLIPGLVVLAAGSGLVGGVLLTLGAIADLCVFVWLYVSFAFATPAVVLERVGVLRALRRSFALVRRDFWRVLGILLLAWLITLVIGFVIEVPFALGTGALSLTGGTGATTTIGLVIAAVGGVVAGTIVQPFNAGVHALLYVDQRMRREGLDLTLRQAAGVGQRLEEARPAPPPGW